MKLSEATTGILAAACGVPTEATTGILAAACGVPISILVPATCLAHPGHGEDGGDWSLHHYLTEPEHLLLGALVVVLLAIAFFLWRSIRARRKPGVKMGATRPAYILPTRSERLR